MSDDRRCDWCDEPAKHSARAWGGDGINPRYSAEIRLHACERHRRNLTLALQKAPKAPPPDAPASPERLFDLTTFKP